MSMTKERCKAFDDKLKLEMKALNDLDVRIRRATNELEAASLTVSVNEQLGDTYAVMTAQRTSHKAARLTGMNYYATFEAAKGSFDAIEYEKPRAIDAEFTTIFPCGLGSSLICVKADFDQSGDSYTALVQIRPASQ